MNESSLSDSYIRFKRFWLALWKLSLNLVIVRVTWDEDGGVHAASSNGIDL